MPKLNKLPQELINQIAAGEVVERPASVVKELVDNSIDAKASHIKVRIQDGGMKLIEISDNGIGIEKENILDVFLPHTTSKISKLEDLNNLNTMGFRGEALSTILSVSNAIIVSKNENSDSAHSVNFNNSREISKGARDTGTTISISNLFHNTPARLKFMKSAETEYRKILEVFIQYCISNPNIHFELIKDEKQIFNLPPKDFKGRVKDVLKKEYIDRMIEIHSEGAGVKVEGLIANPRDTVEKGAAQYIFVNNRPIWDNGISKSVHQGYSRFIPHMYKVPYIVKIQVDGGSVDVNVHPRKEEVKFINPYRIYSQVEEAVSKALQNATKQDYQPHDSINDSTSTSSSSFFDSSSIRYDTSNKIKEIRFDKKPSDFNINKSITFSKQVLSPSNNQLNTFNFEIKEEQKSFNECRSISQVFNKYIIVEFENEMWMIDQHAAAERINFEKLEKQLGGEINDIQHMLVPDEFQLNTSEISFLNENIDFFKKLGFDYSISNESIYIKSIPAHLVGFNIKEVFTSMFELDSDTKDLKNNFDKKKTDILATIACHSSVRAGQHLTIPECENIYRQLGNCINPFSCPHGRPAIWKLKLTEIDTNFYRTY